MTQAARREAQADEVPDSGCDERSAAALRAVETAPSSLFAPLNGAVLHQRMHGVRMSAVEREIALDALRLGREIGNALLRLHLFFRRRRTAAQGPMRRKPVRRPSRQASDAGADEWQVF